MCERWKISEWISQHDVHLHNDEDDNVNGEKIGHQYCDNDNSSNNDAENTDNGNTDDD